MKEAIPLVERGHTVHMIAQKIPSHVERMSSFCLSSDVGQLIEAVKVYSDSVDLWHVHNEPSYYVTLLKEHSDKPVVLDVHDSYLARLTPEEWEQLMDAGQKPIRITTEERNNFQLADALVFPSKPFGDLIREEFKLTQPHLVLPSYVPRWMYQYAGREWLGGLTYEGKVDLGSEVGTVRGAHGFKYADYEALAREAHRIGMDFHLYTVREDEPFKAIYKDISYIHEPRGIDRLLRSLTRHDWGLVGNLMPTREWEVAFPNKLFEYIAAGVPVVAINAAECSRFIEEHGVGITVGSLEELASRWSEHTEIRKRLIGCRQKFTMENRIQELEQLYREVLNG